MGSGRVNWRIVSACTAALCLGLSAVGFSQFTSFNDRTGSVLEGNWQSCREDDGQYSERIYDGKLPGIGRFELHMGPFHDFALFRGVQDAHRAHDSADNLLTPHTLDLVAGRASHTWQRSGFKLRVSVAGGSREECESFWVSLRPVARPSSD